MFGRGAVVDLATVEEVVADLVPTTEFRGETLAGLIGRVVEAGGVTGLGDMVEAVVFGIGVVGRTAAGRTGPRTWALAMGTMNTDIPRATANLILNMHKLLEAFRNKNPKETMSTVAQ